MKGYLTCGKYSTLCGLVGIIILAPSFLFAQPSWTWAKKAGTLNDQRGYGIAADTNGFTYTTGYISGLLNAFDLNLISSGGMDDVFIAKYDVDGNNVWVKRA